MKKLALAAVLMVSLTAQADDYMGEIIGGIAGGIIGNQVGKGDGRVAATAIGAGIGAIVGGRVQDNMNRRDGYGYGYQNYNNYNGYQTYAPPVVYQPVYRYDYVWDRYCGCERQILVRIQ